MNNPYISVIMPIYCGQKYLSSALESLVNQKDFDKSFEIIAAVDDELEETQQILKKYTSLLPLKVIEGAKSKNWVATTNKAILESKGEWICFLHQDDLFSTNKFAAIEKASKENINASFIMHPITYIDSNNNSLGRPFLPFQYKQDIKVSDIFGRLICQNIIMVPGVTFKRLLISEIGLLNENLRYTADWEYWLRCVRHSNIVYDKRALASFRVHKESQTVSLAEKQKEYHDNLQVVVEENVKYLKEYYNDKEANRIERMARFGVEFNCFLSAKGVGLKPSIKQLFKAICKCGLYNFICYLNWAKVYNRVLPRLRIGIKG